MSDLFYDISNAESDFRAGHSAAALIPLHGALAVHLATGYDLTPDPRETPEPRPFRCRLCDRFDGPDLDADGKCSGGCPLDCGGSHAPDEDCMNCAKCGRCTEELDDDDTCPACGGRDDSDSDIDPQPLS